MVYSASVPSGIIRDLEPKRFGRRDIAGCGYALPQCGQGSSVGTAQQMQEFSWYVRIPGLYAIRVHG